MFRAMEQIVFSIRQLANEQDLRRLRMKQSSLVEPIASLSRDLETLLGRENLSTDNESQTVENEEAEYFQNERVQADAVFEQNEQQPRSESEEEQCEVPSEPLEIIERSDKFLNECRIDKLHLQCAVLQVYSPSAFLVTFIPSTKPRFNSMPERENVRAERKLSVGQHCFALVSTGGVERVKILSLKDNTEGICFAKVLYIDDGKVEWAAVNSLLPLPLVYYYYPRSSLHCCLSGIAPRNNDWGEKTIDWLKKFCSVDGSTYHITVEGNRIGDTDIVPVHLYKTDEQTNRKDTASSGLLQYASEEVIESTEDEVYGLTGPVEELTLESALPSLPPEFNEMSKSERPHDLMSSTSRQQSVVQVTVRQDILSNGMKRDIKFTVYSNIDIVRAESFNRFYAIIRNSTDQRSSSTAEDAVCQKNKVLTRSEAPANSIMFGLHGLRVRALYAFNDKVYSVLLARFLRWVMMCDRLAAVCTVERSNIGSSLVVLFGWPRSSAGCICLNEQLSLSREIDAKNDETIRIWSLAKDVLDELDERQAAAANVATEEC
ncbi:hypothetical protein D918_00349 [Trichuris suis]|nr:hypothetical protein D918_00349 [Trichuris suis]